MRIFLMVFYGDGCFAHSDKSFNAVSFMLKPSQYHPEEMLRDACFARLQLYHFVSVLNPFPSLVFYFHLLTSFFLRLSDNIFL